MSAREWNFLVSLVAKCVEEWRVLGCSKGENSEIVIFCVVKVGKLCDRHS